MRTSKSGRKRVRFEVKASPKSRVFVAGSFNDWNPSEKKMKYKDGIHSISMLLPPGEYEYKFVVDGVWCMDPKCEDWTTNGVGSLNSVIVVE